MRALRGARGGFGERARPYRAARPVYDRGPLSTRAVMRDTPAWAHVRGSGAAAKIRLPHHSPEWRNGRRRGLKIPRGQPRVSSTLTSGMHTAQRRRVYAKRAIKHAITGAVAAGCLLAAAASRGLPGAGTVVQQAQASPRELEPRVVAVDAMPCKACHETIFNTFAQTAHFKTSAEATAQSIKGSFIEGHNLLRTRADGIYFKMERRKGAFYQTGVDSAQSRARTERIDLVVGSGRRGQSYLYWRNGLLFELPVSYLAGIDQWINSPGYTDGEIDFARVIVPRCLECHSTSFKLEQDRRALRYSRDYELGIACETCHGDGHQHVQYQASHPAEVRGKYITNPARFSRDRKLDNCALCHSGPREQVRPPFTYRPGERLDDYLLPASDRDAPIPDVHGDQVGLLRRSKCFRSSATMSCSTCHNVHRPQRDLAPFASKCLACHQTSQHPMAAKIGARMITSCIDCHMPNQRSNAIQINTPARQSSLSFRSHAIGIYPEVAATILQSGN